MSDATIALRSVALLCGLVFAAALGGMLEHLPLIALGPVAAWAAALLAGRTYSQAAWLLGLLLGFAAGGVLGSFIDHAQAGTIAATIGFLLIGTIAYALQHRA